MQSTNEPYQVVIEHEFDNTQQVVFEDWIYPNKFCSWWGPKNFINRECTIHARPGGAILVQMEAPDGRTHTMKGIIHEINPPQQIILTTYALDGDGHPVLEVYNTVTFEDQGEKTNVKVLAEVKNVKPDGVQFMAGMEQGWKESLEKLDALVAKVA